MAMTYNPVGWFEIPKKDIGEYGHIAWVEDTEGNFVGLHTRKE